MGALADCFAEVRQALGYVQKDGKNAHFKYTFVSAGNIFERCQPAFIKYKAIVSPAWQMLSRHQIDGSWFNTVMKIQATIRVGDESVTIEGVGEGCDKGDKSVMKAQTAALKYAFMSAFQVSTGDDPEADASVDEKAEKKEKRQTTDLTSLITMAKTVSELEGIKQQMIKHRDNSEYKAWVDAYKSREKEIKENGQAKG